LIIKKKYRILLTVFTLLFHVNSFSLVLDSLENNYNLPYPYLQNSSSGLFMNNPSNFNTQINYDIINNQYLFQNRLGDFNLGTPKILSFEEFQEYNFKKSISNYWNQRSKDRNSQSGSRFGIPKLYIPGQAFDKVFGGNSVDIRPQGSAELIFGLKINRLDNPSLTEEQRRTTTFDFQEKIQMNVIGKIGDKLKLTTNFNTEATFDFENNMKLEYTGYEDEIVKKIEVGNVSLAFKWVVNNRKSIVIWL